VLFDTFLALDFFSPFLESESELELELELEESELSFLGSTTTLMDFAFFFGVDWALESESELESLEDEFGEASVWLESRSGGVTFVFVPLASAFFLLINFFFLGLADPTSLDSSSG
jgi:hypothetical protein